MINIISFLYMGTNMNKLIPLLPAQIKHLQKLHNISLLMINTMMNTEMYSNICSILLPVTAKKYPQIAWDQFAEL
jgi:hypothetical protein